MATFFEKQHSSRIETTQTVAAGASSATVTNAFGAQTYQLRLCSNTNCHYHVGNGTLTATTSDPFLPEGFIEYVTVSPGQKIAAIEAASGGLLTATAGTLWVTELS